jgi:hypothetical protein
MLRNLLLAVFLFALALPALAVPVAPAAASQSAATDCHGMPVEKQDDGPQHEGKGVQVHGCIGCIAPLSPAFAIFETAALPFIAQSQPHRELSSTTKRPNIPPPRS